nr:protein ALP1-like [Tanacetum cinerariifolium]
MIQFLLMLFSVWMMYKVDFDDVDCCFSFAVDDVFSVDVYVETKTQGVDPINSEALIVWIRSGLVVHMALKGNVRFDHGLNPFILLEVIPSQDLWIWHAFFGVPGSNNDINVLYHSPLFNDLKTGREPEILFVANGVTYPWGYYLVDGIYSKLATLVKMILKPADDDHSRIFYKLKQESSRKDVERAFGVLKKK